MSNYKDIGTFRFVKQYFNILMLLVFIHGPIMVLASATPIRFVFILSLLLAYLSLDLVLISANFSKIKFNALEVSLMAILCFAVIVGLLNLAPISRRYITDFLMPLSFVLKIALSRHFFSNDTYSKYFTNVYLKKFAFAAFFSAIITIILFYVLVQFIPMYIGLTPIIYPLLIWALLSKKYYLILACLLIILLSGKRSVLLGVVIVFLLYFIGIRKNKLKSVAILISLFLVGLTIFEFTGLKESRAFRKYEWTFYKFQEAMDDPKVMDIVLGGRIGEIQSIQNEMKGFDYVFGKGVGFTYDLSSVGYGNKKEHSNAHFTPLSIISKYGVPFYCILSFYVLFSLFKSRNKFRKHDWWSTFFFLYIIGINIDFIFAYGVFVDKLFPFAIGYLNKKSYV